MFFQSLHSCGASRPNEDSLEQRMCGCALVECRGKASKPIHHGNAALLRSSSFWMRPICRRMRPSSYRPEEELLFRVQCLSSRLRNQLIKRPEPGSVFLRINIQNCSRQGNHRDSLCFPQPVRRAAIPLQPHELGEMLSAYDDWHSNGSGVLRGNDPRAPGEGTDQGGEGVFVHQRLIAKRDECAITISDRAQSGGKRRSDSALP